MPPRTRSQRLAQAQAGDDAPPASQSSQSTVQDSTVEVGLNSILFDKSHRLPVVIYIPRDMYDKPSAYCRGLFAQQLSEEYGVSAKAVDIVFLTPKEPLSVGESAAKGWAASIDDLEEQFSRVLLPEAFSDNIVVVDDELIHLVITIRDGGSVENELEATLLNWTLFDKSDRIPHVIGIERDLYDGPSSQCRRLFAKRLSKEYKVSADTEDVVFWTPKDPISLREAAAEGWAASIDNFKERFSSILPGETFPEHLVVVDPKVIQLVITIRDGGSVENELDAAVPELKEFKLYNKTVLTQGPTPSEGAKLNGYHKIQADEAQVIYDGRWAPNGLSTNAPPIQIFHPIFDDFIHLVNDPGVQPTPDDLKKVQELMYYAAEVGRVEEEGKGGYNEGLCERLRHIVQDDVHLEPNSDATSADGVITLQVSDARIVFLILELKRELGEGGCDPSLQAGLSMKRSWINPSRAAIRERCCCPTFLVAGGGPWFSILGGVFTDKFIVQRLTDMRWNALSSTEEDSRVYHNARVLISLRECLVKLHAFYKGLQNVGLQDVPPFVANEPHPRYFPYPTSFMAKDGSLTRIRYLASLEKNAACVTYLAEICDEPGRTGDPVKVVVKFVARYGKEAHEFLASHGYAPALRYCGPLPKTKLSGISGPAQSATPGLLCLRSDLMHMVVMDYIHARPNPPPDVRGHVKTILTLLHSEGYVFGDLRWPNILCDADADGKVKMIDFNWCGRYNMKIRDEGLPNGLQKEIDKNMSRIQVEDGPYAYYPLSMSTVDNMWAAGMEPLAQIRPQHDWIMFGKLWW